MRAPILSPAVLLTAGLVLLLAHACNEAPTAPFDEAQSYPAAFGTGADPAAACSPLTERALIADNGGVTVGTVRVGNDESHLLVTLETQDGWVMTKTHVFVATDVVEIPVSNGGNPTPGKFPHTQRHGSGTTAYTYAVPLSVLAGATPAVIAAHADVVLGERKEGAWGDGEMIAEGGNWGTYFTHPVANCASQLVTVADGGIITFVGLTLVVPPGAVAEDVQITVKMVDVEDLEVTAGQAGVAAANALIGNVIAIEGTAYDLGPDGLAFQIPASISLGYDEDNLPDGALEEQLQVFAINGVFFGLASTVDAQANLVTASVEHFSTFFVGVPAPQPDLVPVGASFSSPGSGLLDHSLVVQNAGNAPADITGVTVMTHFSEDTELDVGDDISCGRQLSSTPPLDPGESVTIAFSCNMGTQTGAYILYEVDRGNTVAESDETNNVLAVEYVPPTDVVDLRLAGFGFSPATKLAGFPVTVHAIAENAEVSTAAVDATLRIDFDELVSFNFDDLPDGCEASNPIDVGQRFECSLGMLDAGQQVTRDLTVRPLQVRTYAVVGTVLPTAGDPTPEDNDQHGSFIASAPVVDLSTDIVAPSVVDPGETVLYQMRVLNDAGVPNTLPSAVLWLEVTGAAELVSMSPACTDFGASQTFSVILQCSVPELEAGAAAFLDATVRATTPGQTLNATARVVPPTYVVDMNSANDTESVETRVRAELEADLSVVFTNLTGSIAKANLDFGYFLSVASDGASPDAVSGATLTLVITGPVSTQSAPTGCSSSSTTVPAATTIICSLPDIAPNQTLPGMSIIVRPATSAIGGTLDATATVAMPPGGVDPDPDNNSDNHVVDVVAPQVDMYVVQFTESADPVELGGTVRYTIQAGNRTSAVDAAPEGSRVDLRVTSGNAEVVSIPVGCTDFSSAVLEPVLVGCETGLLDFGEVSLAYEIEIRPLSAGALEVTAEARPHTGSIDANPDDNTQVETTTVNASVPELSGQITFMSTRTGPAVLHTKDLGTGTVAMFLAGGLQVFGEDPSWSSDGSQIAIGGGSLRLIASNGSNAPVTLPIGDLFSPRHPRWSPDGMKIVFQAVDDGDPDQDWELFVIDVATTAITRLTNNAVPDEAPDWAPDGSNRILFTRDGSSLRTVTAAGGSDTELRSGGNMRHARWSPGGAEIAFSLQHAAGWSIEKFAVVDPSVLTTLTNDGENNHSPVWSPDGFFLGFVKGEPDDESPGIYYVLADGTGIAQVLESADAEDYDVDWKQP